MPLQIDLGRRRVGRAKGRIEREPQRRDQLAREPLRRQAGPVVQRPGVVAAGMGDQPTEQQFPVEKRRRQPDRLQLFTGRVVLAGFVKCKGIANGVEGGP